MQLMPPSIEQQITFIYATDLNRSADFYERVMGFSLWLDQDSCRIYTVAESGLIGVCQSSTESKGRADGTSALILTIVTPEVDAWYDYLQQHGVQFEKPPQINQKYNIYHCFLRDPDGYLIEIQRFLHDTD